MLIVSGSLMVLASLYKFGKREDLLEYGKNVYKYYHKDLNLLYFSFCVSLERTL